MKNLVKLFALTVVGISLFSCTTDEYDAALEESVKVTENIQNAQFREAEEEVKEQENTSDMSAKEDDGNPIVIIIKKD
ncbi:MAG: hypothetical protein E6Q45_05990 [Flavobacterium sp.]|nr:MAG: hypothetical protein E6Q45_05990 [Flavobacterium sp.]